MMQTVRQIHIHTHRKREGEGGRERQTDKIIIKGRYTISNVFKNLGILATINKTYFHGSLCDSFVSFAEQPRHNHSRAENLPR